ncbi:hypothetical protein MRX96_030830 [Rhipicephalus microplus]
MGHYIESTSHEGLRYYFEEAYRLDYDKAKEILAIERAARPAYGGAWTTADFHYQARLKQNSSPQWRTMEQENVVAIICYTLEKPNICRQFNQLCRAARPTKESWNSFPFKSLLHFLISAFNRLPNLDAPMVFRGVDKFAYSNDEARFSQFLSASVCPQQAAKFGHGKYRLVLHRIPDTLVKDISVYSIYPKHREVLIWPFCVFTLTAGKEHDVKVLKFDHNKTSTFPESLSRMPSVSSNCSTTAEVKPVECPPVSGEQAAFTLGTSSAKPASQQSTEKSVPFGPPAHFPLKKDVRGAEAGTSRTVAPQENQKNVIDKIKQGLVIPATCDSNNQPSLKVVPEWHCDTERERRQSDCMHQREPDARTRASEGIGASATHYNNNAALLSPRASFKSSCTQTDMEHELHCSSPCNKQSACSCYAPR